LRVKMRGDYVIKPSFDEETGAYMHWW